MKQIVTVGATSKRMVVFVQNGTSTVGGGLTGLTHSSAGLTWYYYSETSGTDTAITLAGQTVGTWTSGGFVEIDSTHMPGFYEIGVPNACLASSSWCTMQLQGAASMVPVNIEIEIISFNLQTATQPVNVIQWSGGAVPSPNITGKPLVDVADWLGTAVTAATGGIPDVNVKNYNNQTAATDSNNLPKVDVQDFGGTAGTFTSGVPNANASGLTGTVTANVVSWLGTAVTSAAGVPNVNIIQFGGTNGTFTSGLPNVNANLIGTPAVNVTEFGGTAGTFTNGVPNANASITGTMSANVVQWLGTAVTAATGGVPDVNVKNYNNHTATTDTNNLPKVDVEDFGGTAGTFAAGVPTANAGGVTGTVTANVVSWLGHAVNAAINGYPDVNVKFWNNEGAQTDANDLPSVNVVDWLGTGMNVNLPGVPVVDVGAFGGTGLTFSGSFPEVAVATNLDKTGYALATGGITVRKNQAMAGFTFPMFAATAPNGLATGLSVTAARSIDGGGVAGSANAVTEVGSGIYELNLAASDLDGNSITFIFTANGALDAAVTFVTQP
jgi:hypothetical protein